MQSTVTIEIYVTTHGRKPFIEWLNRLADVKARAVIRSRLNRIRLGNYGDCHSIGDGVHEFRIDYGPGYRIYFGRMGMKVILLLCAGIKGNQRKDMERAKLYLKEYMEES